MNDLEAKATQNWKKKSKKRAKSDFNDSTRVKHANTAGEMQELDAEPDINEPTMAEKLASLDLLSDDKAKNTSEKEAPPTMNIPSADSVHVLLKQALNAQDHGLLLDCLYTNDEKVIRKSTALLRPSDVLNLLKSLLSMIELRGAVIICALPWLRSVLSQHASAIASQESSLLLLNSLYQLVQPVELKRGLSPGLVDLLEPKLLEKAGLLIESRTSTFRSALQLSTCLDCLFAGIPEAQADEESAAPVVIYEDNDSEQDQEEEYDDTIEGDEESEGFGAVIDSAYNSDGSDVISD